MPQIQVLRQALECHSSALPTELRPQGFPAQLGSTEAELAPQGRRPGKIQMLGNRLDIGMEAWMSRRQSLLPFASPKNGHATCSYSDPKTGSKNQEGRSEGKEREEPFATQKVNANRVKSQTYAVVDATTWLSPFADAYCDRTGGLFPFAKAARTLRILTKAHPSAEVVAAWRRYLAETEVTWISVARFAETYGHWSGAVADPPRRRRPTADERKLEAIRRSDELFDRLTRGAHGPERGEANREQPGDALPAGLVGGANGFVRH